jgi:cell wall-associated NlpC family hydrolase
MSLFPKTRTIFALIAFASILIASSAYADAEICGTLKDKDTEPCPYSAGGGFYPPSNPGAVVDANNAQVSLGSLLNTTVCFNAHKDSPGDLCFSPSTVYQKAASSVSTPVAHAQETPATTTETGKEICDNNTDDNGDKLVDGADPQCYTLLAPLPGLTSINTTEGLAPYLNTVYTLAIGLAGVAGVVLIVVYGIEYMVSESITGKSDALKRVGSVVFGLILLIGSVVLLNTINPNLTIIGINIPSVTHTLEDDTGGDFDAPLATTITAPTGIYFPKTGGSGAIRQVALSMTGNITYRMGGKGGPAPYSADTKSCALGPCSGYCPPGQLCFDCSGFVNYVLEGAGMPTVAGGTSAFFSGAEKITDLKNQTVNQVSATYVNGKALNPGDVLGWLAGENGDKSGHIVMYIGNGQAVESSSGNKGREPGNAVKTFDVSTKYTKNGAQELLWIKRF